MAKRKTDAELLKIGKRIHYGMSVGEARKKFGVAYITAQKARDLYEERYGSLNMDEAERIEVEHAIGEELDTLQRIADLESENTVLQRIIIALGRQL